MSNHPYAPPLAAGADGAMIDDPFGPLASRPNRLPATSNAIVRSNDGDRSYKSAPVEPDAELRPERERSGRLALPEPILERRVPASLTGGGSGKPSPEIAICGLENANTATVAIKHSHEV